MRRTLAVILASHGETDLLVALSRHDPVLVVRQSAIQLVTRLAAGGAIDPGVVVDAAAREPAIRAAILAAIGPASPSWLVALATQWLDAGPFDIELEACEALLRVATASAREIAIGWLASRSQDRAPDACARLIQLLPVDELAAVLEHTSVAMRATALRQLSAPAWPLVARLVGSDDELLAQVFARSDLVVPIDIAVRALVSGRHPIAWALHGRLSGIVVPPPELVGLLPALDAYCRAELAGQPAVPPQGLLPAGVPEDDDADWIYDEDNGADCDSLWLITEQVARLRRAASTIVN